jgi:predicted nucleotidyltransferase
MLAPPPSLSDLAARFGLSLVVRFGSTAAGRATADSDQDIAVWVVLGREALGLNEEAELVVALGDALGGPEVDLTVLNRADPLLLFSVARDGVPLFEMSPGAFAEFKSYAARLYYDSEKFRAAERRYLEARLG